MFRLFPFAPPLLYNLLFLQFHRRVLCIFLLTNPAYQMHQTPASSHPDSFQILLLPPFQTHLPLPDTRLSYFYKTHQAQPAHTLMHQTCSHTDKRQLQRPES